MGGRSPVWDSDAKGAIVGLSLAHTKAHLYRAFLEAAACSLRDAMNAAGENPGQYILLAGGVTKSRLWRQIFADVTGYPVVCPKSGVGANMGDVMPDPARHARYDRCFAACKSIYRHLKDDMKALSAMS